MLECSILWPKVILTNPYLVATVRGKHMRNASVMLNMAHLHHLFFSVAGGMGPIASTFYKCLASMLSVKTHYQTICWLRCSLSYYFYDQ